MSGPDGAAPIVVGVDGSQGSHAAVEWAAFEARRRRLSLRMLCALGQVDASPPEYADAGDRLSDAVKLAAGVAPSAEVTTDVATEGAAAALVAASETASLVVVGSRGLAPMSGMLLGSVSRQVAEHAASDVVVVPGFRPVAYREIVVGVDGSGGGEQALEYAFDEAEARNAALRAVHAIVSPLPLIEDDRPMEERSRWLSDRLAPWIDKHPGVRVTPRLVRGSPVYALATTAMHADLLVVGARGLGGFPRLLIGATGLGVLNHSQCPVMIVRHQPRG